MSVDECLWVLRRPLPQKRTVSTVETAARLRRAAAGVVPETIDDGVEAPEAGTPAHAIDGVPGLDVDVLLGGGNYAFEKAVVRLNKLLEFWSMVNWFI